MNMVGVKNAKKKLPIGAVIIALSLSVLGQIPDKQSGKMGKTEQVILNLANDYADATVKTRYCQN